MNNSISLTDKRIWLGLFGLAAVVLLAMQLVPIEKSNPPVIREPNWDSPQTRELAQRACFDCHSNETVYPWYADIAPMRLLVRDHVNQGRRVLNFSEFNGRLNARELRASIEGGEMPPWDYTLMHPNARLTDQEKTQLIEGLAATASQS